MRARVVLIPLIAGISIGYFLRKKKPLDLKNVTLGAIMPLIFSMGFSIGSNNDLLQSMPKIGFDAVVMVAFALSFSVVFLKFFARW